MKDANDERTNDLMFAAFQLGVQISDSTHAKQSSPLENFTLLQDVAKGAVGIAPTPTDFKSTGAPLPEGFLERYSSNHSSINAFMKSVAGRVLDAAERANLPFLDRNDS